MVNRQVISQGEREALAAESHFWSAIERYILTHRNGPERVYQMESGPIPLHASNSYVDYANAEMRMLYVDSLQAFRTRENCGNIHWVATWDVDSKIYGLIATAAPVQRGIDKLLMDRIRDVQSYDEAIERLEQYKQDLLTHAFEGWDYAFHNQPFGKPSAWSWLNGFWIDHTVGSGPSGDLLRFLQVTADDAMRYANIWPAHGVQPPSMLAEHMPRHRSEITIPLIFAHTARSMYLRTLPRQTGSRHKTTNDAPSHNSVRAMMIIRVKELFPEAYENARHFLPNTTQQRILAVRLGRAMPGADLKPIEQMSESPPPRHVPARPKIVVPQSAVEWVAGILDIGDEIVNDGE